MLAAHGCRDPEPLARFARRGWPKRFLFGYVPRLGREGLLTDAERKAFEDDWAERERDSAVLLVTPPMVPPSRSGAIGPGQHRSPTGYGGDSGPAE